MSWNQPKENSIASLREGIERFDGVEFDIRLTRDGELVLHHDRTLSVPAAKKVGLPKYVEDCTLEQVCEFGFDSFDNLLSDSGFMECWLQESRFVCLELKIPHPASKAGGGWMSPGTRREHLRKMMKYSMQKLEESGVEKNNVIFYSFHDSIGKLNRSLGGGWNAVSLRPVVPPFGSSRLQKAITFPKFIANPLKRLIKRQRKDGAPLIPIAMEYLEGWTRHLPLGRSVGLSGKGLERFNNYRAGDPVVVWQVEDRHESLLLEAGMSPLTDNADPSFTKLPNGMPRRTRPATMMDDGVPWHESSVSQRTELIEKWRKKWYWKGSVADIVSACSPTTSPWQAVRMLGHRGCGKTG